MGMRLNHGESDRFATIVGGRPGGKGGRAVTLSPALAAFLTRLLDDAEIRRRFLADPDGTISADSDLTPAEREMLRSIPPEKLRALETMIPAAAASKRAAVATAAVTALGVFLGLALPVIAESGPATMPPGGIRPDFESDERIAPETGIRPGFEEPRLQITKGIRPDFEFEEFDEDLPTLPAGTSEVVTGTSEVETRKTDETDLRSGEKPDRSARPSLRPSLPIDRPNVTRGIRPDF